MSFDLFIINYIAPIFYKLLFMSFTAICIGFVLILLRRFADGKISPYWKYAMWALALVALLIPFRIQSDLALLNTTKKIQNVSFRDDEIKAKNQYIRYKRNNQSESQGSLSGAQQLLKMQKDINSLHIKSIVFEFLIPLIWLIIMLLMILFLIISHIRLKHKLNLHSLKIKKDHMFLLEKCKNTLHISRNVKLQAQDFIDSPALTGLFYPKIILPYYVKDMSDESIEFILLHELSHLKRLDVLMNDLLIALRIIYCFNPAVGILCQFIRQDMEVLNDTYVLNCIGSEYSKSYLRALVEIVSRYNRLPYTPKLLCMVDGKENMERRIKMIKLEKMFKRHKKAAALLSLSVFCMISVLFLTVNDRADEVKLPLSDLKDIPVDAELKETLETSENLTFDKVISPTALEEAVTSAILSNSDNGTELLAEGHIILENEDKLDSKGMAVQKTVYVLRTTGGFEFVNNSLFAQTDGAGVTPIRLTFDIDKNGYSLTEYKEPLDGSYYVPSIKEMFPEKLWDRAIENNADDAEECMRQHKIYAKNYLDRIGKEAKIITNISDADLEYVPRNNKEIDSAIENFYKSHPDFPFWIGSIEKIESNIRYVYETKWSGNQDGEGIITFIKYDYISKNILDQFVIEIKEGKALYLEGIS